MRQNRALRGAVVLAILIGAGLIAARVWSDEQDRVQTENEELARRTVAAVTRTVTGASNSLLGASALLDADGGMREGDFRVFARELIPNAPFEALAWEPRVTGPKRLKFVEQRLGTPIVGITPEGGFRRLGRRARYFPIEFVYPENSGRAGVIGVDLASDPARAYALLSARDMGAPRMTGPIASARTREPVVTIFKPVYRRGKPLDTRRQRRRALKGMVSGGLVLKTLENLTLQQLPEDAAIDITDDGRTLIGSEVSGDDTATSVAPIAGRRWRVEADGGTEASPGSAVAIAGGGLLLAVLAVLLFSLADRRELILEARRREAEQRARREALQARAAEVLERGHTVAERLGSLAEALVPAMADVCLVDVDLGGTGWQRVAVAGIDEFAQATAAELRRNGAGHVRFDVDHPTLLNPAPQNLLSAGGNGTAGIGASSAMLLPLSVREKQVGVMILAKLGRTGRPDFTSDDLEQMRDVATRASLALDSAWLYERERATARTLQGRLLPAALAEPPGFEVAALYRAGGEGLEVGGDFYDLFAVPGGWVAVVGDVCGSGAEAASLTSLLRHTLRTGARLSDPEHSLAVVDAAAREETAGSTFLTLAAAWIDEKPSASGGVGVRLGIAGHPEPRIIRADGSVERIPPNGPLLGVIERWSLETTRIELAPGETLLLFTDGLTEARRNGEIYGDDRLDEQLRAGRASSLDDLVKTVERDAVRFAGDVVGDDLALLAIRPRRTQVE